MNESPCTLDADSDSPAGIHSCMRMGEWDWGGILHIVGNTCVVVVRFPQDFYVFVPLLIRQSHCLLSSADRESETKDVRGYR